MGGVYRDQDLEVVTKWLRKLMQSQVEAAYQTVRKEYLLPPTTTAVRPPSGVPTTNYPSPSSPTTSEGAGPDTSSDLAKNPDDSSRHTGMPSPQADTSEQGSERAGGDNNPCSDVVEQPSRKRRRRRSNPKDGDIKAAGKPELF